MLLLLSAAAGAAHLLPHNIQPAVVSTRSFRVTWGLVCTAERCDRQQAFRIVLTDARTHAVTLDTGRLERADASHTVVAPLTSARSYTLNVSVYSDDAETARGASVRVHSAILDNDWQGEWLGGFTQLRGAFKLEQPRVVNLS